MIAQPATLLSFLNDLRESHIDYDLSHPREEAIMVHVAVPGERWEIEFLEDGSVETEIFRSDGNIQDASSLAHLFQRFSD